MQEINSSACKVLIVPMAAMAETAGPGSRCRILVKGFLEAGLEVRTCMAKDVNYVEITGTPNYELAIPTPMGMPKVSANYFFPLVQKLGITAKKTVNSFEQVLMLTGNLDKRYLKKSVEDIRSAIQDFQPDVVYSEFNISAMIAAKLEKKKLFGTVSFPTQMEYAANPELSKGLNGILVEYGLQKVTSALELFNQLDEKFCPSISELEPFQKDVTYLGTIKKDLSIQTKNDLPIRIKDDLHVQIKDDFPIQKATGEGNAFQKNILVYMGNGTISASKMLREIAKAFKETTYQVYIASAYLKPQEVENIHVAPRWDFDQLWNETVLFLHHGGQNSMVDGLLHGVPQIVVPGKVFERKYNGQSLEKVGAGKILPTDKFQGETIKIVAEEVIASKEMKKNAIAIGEKLLQAGGIQKIVDRIMQANE